MLEKTQNLPQMVDFSWWFSSHGIEIPQKIKQKKKNPGYLTQYFPHFPTTPLPPPPPGSIPRSLAVQLLGRDLRRKGWAPKRSGCGTHSKWTVSWLVFMGVDPNWLLTQIGTFSQGSGGKKHQLHRMGFVTGTIYRCMNGWICGQILLWNMYYVKNHWKQHLQ